MTKHTTGPYTTTPMPDCKNSEMLIRGVDDLGFLSDIATVHHFDDDMVANANLFAAAPALLVALEGLCVPEGGGATLLERTPQSPLPRHVRRA